MGSLRAFTKTCTQGDELNLGNCISGHYPLQLLTKIHPTNTYLADHHGYRVKLHPVNFSMNMEINLPDYPPRCLVLHLRAHSHCTAKSRKTTAASAPDCLKICTLALLL